MYVFTTVIYSGTATGYNKVEIHIRISLLSEASNQS
jgi:hypothetical protein